MIRRLVKKLGKRLTRADAVRRMLCWLGAHYIRLAYRTSKWQVIGGDIPAAYWDSNRPFIVAFWHSRIMLMSYCWRPGLPIHMLVSQHRDGRLIADTIRHLDVGSVAGSTNRGGLAALRGMLKLLKAGESVGITPDGPRGPRQRVSPGIINLAKLAGLPIVPVSYSVKRRVLAGSWDRFLVALPFSTGIFVWGRPIEVPRDSSDAGLEALREDLEMRLNALTAAADGRMGHAAIEPAPWPSAETAPKPQEAVN